MLRIQKVGLWRTKEKINMPTNELRDFFHYTSIEEENLLKSLANFGQDVYFIQSLDELYKSCFELNPINDPNLKIPAFLYTNVHREFYLASVSFLRLLSSKSFNSLRCAIDSTFTAYYLLKNPNKTSVYLSKVNGGLNDENPEWNKIFQNIKRTIKNDIANFPLAEHLPKMHEFCSIYAHSDALGIMHRYELNKESLRLEGKYFDYEDTEDDYKRWYGALMFGYFKIFLVFWHEIFKKQAGTKLSEIERKIELYRNHLGAYMKKYPLREEV